MTILKFQKNFISLIFLTSVLYNFFYWKNELESEKTITHRTLICRFEKLFIKKFGN